MLTRCFAKVVLPEHEAPLGCHLLSACIDQLIIGQVYPMPISIVRLAIRQEGVIVVIWKAPFCQRSKETMQSSPALSGMYMKTPRSKYRRLKSKQSLRRPYLTSRLVKVGDTVKGCLKNKFRDSYINIQDLPCVLHHQKVPSKNTESDLEATRDRTRES